MTIQDSPVVAGKIVPKSLLVKQHQREKMAQEISLHKTLNHPYIVKLYSYFEDKVSCTKTIWWSVREKGNEDVDEQWFDRNFFYLRILYTSFWNYVVAVVWWSYINVGKPSPSQRLGISWNKFFLASNIFMIIRSSTEILSLEISF